jgi:hypothetical protein
MVFLYEGLRTIAFPITRMPLSSQKIRLDLDCLYLYSLDLKFLPESYEKTNTFQPGLLCYGNASTTKGN